MDCKGRNCVVGWDGIARAAPPTDEDLKQRQLDEAEHLRRAQLPPAPTMSDIIAELSARIAALESKTVTTR